MPVTAKLSRKFYEQFGDDIAGELVDWFNAVDLTYQTQLKEINELNWERFKATLLGESASLRGEVRAGFAELRTEIVGVQEQLHGEIDGGLAKLHGEIDGGLAKLHGEIDSGLAKLRGEIDSGLAKLRGEIEGLRTEMATMRADLLRWMFIYWMGSVIGLGGVIFAALQSR